ncbi:MAG: MFS transporter, partial [Pseudomonas sp.]
MSSTTLNATTLGGAVHSAERQALRKAARASFMGNFVEWFDYAAYGYLATIIAATFFPQTDKT